MSATKVVCLWKTIRNALLANVEIEALCGANRIHDEAPDQAKPPYITLGDVRVRDWSTASETGSEISMAVEVWTAHHGYSECLEIAALVESVVQAITSIPDYNLVLLQTSQVDTSRRDRGRLALARVILRALVDNN